MDEREFMGKWISGARALRCEVGDVRAGVWERIAEAESTSDAMPLPFTTILKLDAAAAVVIAAGSGALYFLLSDFSGVMFWNASLQAMAGAY